VGPACSMTISSPSRPTQTCWPRTPKVGFNIAPVDGFLAGKTRVKHVDGSEIEITKEALPEPTEIVVLEPAL